MRPKKIWLLIITGCVLLAGLFIAYDRFQPGTSLFKGSASRPMQFKPEWGEQFQYDLEYRSHSESESDDKINVSLADSIRVNFDGKLALTSWRETASGREFLGEFSVVPVDTSIMLPSQPVQFSVQISPSHEISNIKMEKKDFETSSFILIDVLKNFQLSLPQAEPHKRLAWSSSEPFMKEAVTVKYSICGLEKDAICIARNYEKSAKVQISAQGKIHLNSSDFSIRSIQSDKNFVNLGPGGLKVNTKSQFKARLAGIRKVNIEEMLAKRSASDTVTEQLDQSQYQAYLERESFKNVLGDETVDTLKDQLENGSASSLKANMKIYQMLRALFMLHPDAIAQFERYLLEFGIFDERFNVLAVAITDTPGMQAEKALLGPIQGQADLPKKLRLLTHIAFKESVSQETETTLFNMAQTAEEGTFQRSIELTLGGVAHNSRDDAPERSKRILDVFKERLGAAEDPLVKTHYLTAIGNIGIPEQVPSIKPYLASPDTQVRAMAYQGFRFIPGWETSEILLNGLAQDQSQRVREIIADSFTYRPNVGNELRQIAKALDHETNITVIKALIRSLAAQAKNDPFVPSFLQTYLKNCGHPDLCDFVRGVYEGL